MRIVRVGCCLAAVALTGGAFAEGEQRFCEIGDLRLQSGETLKDCKVGYRTYGVLNSARSNAVLFPTWYLGKSGDLGSFKAGGYVDGSKYFVIAVDALGNGVSTSPSNSASQPEGSFPDIGIRDMVESQHAMLLKLGIPHLRAVVGISMGGMQTFQWITSYPDFMDRAVPIVGTPRPSSYDLMFDQSGLNALRLAIASAGARSDLIRTWADFFWLALRTPAYFVRTTSGRAGVASLAGFESALLAWDPYDMQCDLRALASLDVFAPFADREGDAARAVNCKVLVINAAQDHCVNPAPPVAFAKLLGARVILLPDDSGHQSPGEEMKMLSPAISKFLGS